MQGSAPCEICTAVRHVATATHKYRVLACAITRQCMQIFYQSRSCVSNTHVGAHRCTVTLGSSFFFFLLHHEVKHWQLDWLVLRSIPCQHNWITVSDSASIQLHYAHRHLNARTRALIHHILLIGIPCLFLSSLLAWVCPASLLPSSLLCVSHFRRPDGNFQKKNSEEALVANRVQRNKNSVIRLLCPSVQFNLCFVYGHWSINPGLLM